MCTGDLYSFISRCLKVEWLISNITYNKPFFNGRTPLCFTDRDNPSINVSCMNYVSSKANLHFVCQRITIFSDILHLRTSVILDWYFTLKDLGFSIVKGTNNCIWIILFYYLHQSQYSLLVTKCLHWNHTDHDAFLFSFCFEKKVERRLYIYIFFYKSTSKVHFNQADHNNSRKYAEHPIEISAYTTEG